MSNPCCVHFIGLSANESHPTIYVHNESYPAGEEIELKRFFRAVKKQCQQDTRFDDPSYLAAKYLVYKANQLCSSPKTPLCFLGLSIIGFDEDLGIHYFVHCIDAKTPVITWKGSLTDTKDDATVDRGPR